ncbi:hypothetical protein ACJX0J_030783, partial [Zea mays]
MIIRDGYEMNPIPITGMVWSIDDIRFEVFASVFASVSSIFLASVSYIDDINLW